MNRTMQMAIIKKDVRGLVANKRLFPVLLVVPLVFTVVLPTIFILIVRFAPGNMNMGSSIEMLLNVFPSADPSASVEERLLELFMNHIMPVFFMIIPIMAASVMAASSFVGEKEKRTLETLLYCPLSLRQIFRAKVYASFLLSMLVSFGSFLMMLLVVEVGLLLTMGSFLLPSFTWLITMFLLAPAVSLIAITLIVRGSAKAQTVEEAQQRAVFLILPILLLIVGQFTGVLIISTWLLLGIGAVFAAIAAFMTKQGMRKFNYETLLKV